MAQLAVTVKLDADYYYGMFEETDAILEKINVSDISIDLIISILSSTQPASHKLENRVEFYSRVEKYVYENYEDPEGLLRGLK